MKLSYDGPLEPGMILTAPDNDDRLGFRRVRLVAPHPFAALPPLWIYEELGSRGKIGRYVGELGVCPEINLRVVFHLEGRDVTLPARELPPPSS